jgi:hypothetical protein
MKHRFSFLSPLAVAVAALTSDGITRSVDAQPITGPGTDQAVQEPAPPGVSGSAAFVLTRNAAGEIQTAQHQSHWSHSSHASHASHVSHQSHYSSSY